MRAYYIDDHNDSPCKAFATRVSITEALACKYYNFFLYLTCKSFKAYWSHWRRLWSCGYWLLTSKHISQVPHLTTSVVDNCHLTFEKHDIIVKIHLLLWYPFIRNITLAIRPGKLIWMNIPKKKIITFFFFSIKHMDLFSAFPSTLICSVPTFDFIYLFFFRLRLQ